MFVLWMIAVCAVGIQLATLLPNLGGFPVLSTRRTSAAAGALGEVSIVIPARDEAAHLPTTLPRVLRQAGAAEVVVLDDGSSDDTPAILAKLASAHPRLRVVRGAPLPPGWSGKNWACYQLSQHATGEVLVFTDADVTWEDGALDRILGLMHEHDADLVSVWPRQRTRTLIERLFVPWINLGVLSWLPYWAVVHLRDARYAAGNGQLMAWRRDAYIRAGTHAAIAAEALEDVTMARRAKAAGCRVRLALGPRLLSTRMYTSGREVIEGIGRHLASMTGGTRVGLVGMTLLFTLVYGAWPLLAWFDARWLWVGGLALLQQIGGYAKLRRPPLEALLLTLSWVPLWAIAAYTLRHWGRYRWKGRSYRHGAGEQPP